MARKVAGVNEASSKLRTCIATVSIAGDFREKLAAISRAGFTGIEIFEQDFLAYDGREQLSLAIQRHVNEYLVGLDMFPGITEVFITNFNIV